MIAWADYKLPDGSLIVCAQRVHWDNGSWVPEPLSKDRWLIVASIPEG